ncbi:MAG: AAA family ATPase [Pseudomonadota bacterium]|nr:AAA family ATPase [Pseudomonadota bacterium]
MYLEHYGLNEPPFSITPDPRFVYLSERHRDALAHLLFGVTQGGGGGFVQLTGEVGTGKTTLSRLLLEQIPDNTRVALVLNPRQSATELLETVCEELHLDLEGARGSAKALVDRLNAYLLGAYAQGLRVVLIIDEAQNLPIDALEQVRLLTNLETDTQKLLQIILIGQPELRDMLARPELRQLAQRITARFHLTPLHEAETADYLRHRYRVAGGHRFPFSARAMQRIHARSGGVPRLTNVIAERALVAGYARDAETIDDKLVEAAARETLPSSATTHARHGWGLATLGGATALVVALAALWPRPLPPPVAAAASVVEPAEADAAPAGAADLASLVATLDDDAFARAVVDAGATPTAAWSQLLSEWQLPHTQDDAAAAAGCATVLAAGVYCTRGRAGLDRLAAVGRPALLRLREGSNGAWGLLLGTDALRARLWLGGRSVDVDRIALQQRWNGEYAAVWRGEPMLADLFLARQATGREGPAFSWLRARLASSGLDPDSGDVPDAALQAAVLRFQRTHGLATDGVVGPETLFALAADEPGPTLLRELR